MKRIKVCVFPAHGESGVEINNALSNCEGIEVYGAAIVPGHSFYNFKNYTAGFPETNDPAFIEAFNDYLRSNNIDVVYPLTDETVLFFAENKDKFPVLFANCDEYTAQVCNDKRKTYKLFEGLDFCPLIYSKIETYPSFIKPRNGEGSKGIKLIKNPEDVPLDINFDDYVISEYLPGEELTVDCLTDIKGNLVVISPRVRTKIFIGMTVVGETIDLTEDVKRIVSVINSRLNMRGLWFAQLKKDITGNYKLLEVSMRCAGTMCLTRARGYNLPLLALHTAMGKEVAVVDNSYTVTVDRTLFSRYKTDCQYQSVYIDYDGTIIVKNEVCLSVIRFLFQCKNQGKKIYLVTRHNEDHDNTINEDLAQYAISENLFDKIYCLSFSEEKSKVISDRNSIFIDNSYFERKQVHEKTGIPVFGVEGLDALQDWRL